MNVNLKIALQRMGYRKMSDDVWGKPVAYHLFAVQMIKNEPHFFNFMKGTTKVLVYETKPIIDEGDGYERTLKFIEYSTCTKGGPAGFDSDFAFITPEQAFETLL